MAITSGRLLGRGYALKNNGVNSVAIRSQRSCGVAGETGAKFWIHHELAGFESLIKAPGFYQ